MIYRSIDYTPRIQRLNRILDRLGKHEKSLRHRWTAEGRYGLYGTYGGYCEMCTREVGERIGELQRLRYRLESELLRLSS